VIKKGTQHPKYKLACPHGTIKGYYNASELIEYPDSVDIANE